MRRANSIRLPNDMCAIAYRTPGIPSASNQATLS
jgi:hypothetical protein